MQDHVTMDAVRRSAGEVRARTSKTPDVGMILGTGLGALGEELENPTRIPYGEIPEFPEPTVPAHAGQLVLGTLEERAVAVLQGRFHRYEGYSLQRLTLPVRVLRELGAKALVVAGICGGMHPLWELGDFVLLADHINLMGDNPLVGPNLEEQGPRFPDMSEPYDRELQDAAIRAAMERGIRLHRAVYVAVPGPSLETRAEYRMLRDMGADVVGMSTVPEVIVARHMDMRVLGISIITDEALPDALEPVDVPEIIATAEEAAPRLTAVVEAVIGGL